MQRSICNCVQFFTTTASAFKVEKAKNLKGKSTSSQQWIIRQISDPYREKTKMNNYRCRSAFKLIEMDDRFKFLQTGQTIIDCGAAPGSWTQVAVERTEGTIIAVDKQQMYPIEGATMLGGYDLTTPDTHKKISEILQDRKVDVVLSDMAPNATGVRDLDFHNIITLCYTVLRLGVQISKMDGTLLVKLWQCGQTKQLETDLLRFYHSVRTVKPDASRSDSTEIYLLARNFKGLKQTESVS